MGSLLGLVHAYVGILENVAFSTRYGFFVHMQTTFSVIEKDPLKNAFQNEDFQKLTFWSLCMDREN